MQLAPDSDNSIITATKSSASSAAERMANTRLRRRYGFRCLTIEIHKNEIAALVSSGFLDQAKSGDKYALAGALAEFHELFLKHPKALQTVRLLKQGHLQREACKQQRS
jgi:hypothetical protein